MYDGDITEGTVTRLVKAKASSNKKHLEKKVTNKAFFQSLDKNFDKIFKILEEYIPNKKTYSNNLEEEQEMELEIEEEEEKEIQRPPESRPLENLLEDDVLQLAKNEFFKKDSASFVKLPHSLDNSSLHGLLQHNAWSSKLYTTRDFTRTVEIKNEQDVFLRPPRWLILHQSDKSLRIVLISDYEANELYPLFKQSSSSLALLLPRGRQHQERLIAIPTINIPQHLFEQLSIYAGSLYFNSNDEQEAFITFIGYCPAPRNELFQNYFDTGKILNQNSYVPLDNRRFVFCNDCNEKSKFDDDPNDLITQLYKIRNYGVIPNSSHHLQILCSGKKINFI